MKPSTLVFSVLVASAAVGCASTQPQAKCASQPEKAPGEDFDKMSNEQLARKMMELTGSAKLAQQVMASMGESLQKMPGMPAGFMAKLQANARSDDLINLLIPIYVRNYDRPTMIGAIRYYESDEGKALIAHLPDVTRESAAAGRGWGRELAQKTLRDMGISASASGQQ
jgi:hypothetical protein